MSDMYTEHGYESRGDYLRCRIWAGIMDKPILFNSEMIRALLDGRKKQTRRVVKPQSGGDIRKECGGKDFTEVHAVLLNGRRIPCPYGRHGDLLWVRETWYCDHEDPNAPLKEKVSMLDYRATHDCNVYEAGCPCTEKLWKSPIHMPRWASRLTLRITDVRVERVQDISEKDAEAEGVDPKLCTGYPYPVPLSTYTYGFSCLWNSIYLDQGFGWDVNPWVWVIEFDVIKRNIDKVLKDG